jgi:cyclopropane-fatty-acyl-phospholipid synthase
MQQYVEKAIVSTFARAGVEIGGSRPWDIRLRDRRFFKRVLQDGSLGLGEAYMDGWFDCERLDDMIARLVGLGLNEAEERGFWRRFFLKAYCVLCNPQTYRRAFEVGKRHYDMGNDFFEAMLGKTMAYSCGYWREASDLDEAQSAKLELSCRKLGLQPGMRVLDIGCGWGSFLRHAAEHHGVHVTGITISKEQAAAARERCSGLPVEVLFQDYRKVEGQFDRIVSIGQFEHVGPKNHRIYMEIVRRSLKEGGLFLLHTIGNNFSYLANDPWFDKYIFPNSLIPSAAQIAKAAEGLFVLEDWHGFGPDYDKTLMAWHERFEKAWPAFADRYGGRFRRMWRYYLLSCAGAFRARRLQLWQTLWSLKGWPSVYPSYR